MAEGTINKPIDGNRVCTFAPTNITNVTFENQYPQARLFMIQVETKDLDSGYEKAQMDIRSDGQIIIYGYKNGSWTEIKRYS